MQHNKLFQILCLFLLMCMCFLKDFMSFIDISFKNGLYLVVYVLLVGPFTPNPITL